MKKINCLLLVISLICSVCVCPCSALENGTALNYLSIDQLKEIAYQSKGETILDWVSLDTLSEKSREELSEYQINWNAPGLLLYVVDDEVLNLEVISAEGDESFSVTSAICLGGNDADAVQHINNLNVVGESAAASGWVTTTNSAEVAYSNYYFYCRVTSLYQIIDSFSCFKPYKSEVWFTYANSSAATITSIQATTMLRGELRDSSMAIISYDYIWNTFANVTSVTAGSIYSRTNSTIVNANEYIRVGVQITSGTSCLFKFYRNGSWDQAQITSFTI